MARQQIWMVGTAPAGKGGIASVVQQYLEAGMFEGDAVHYESSHHDRNALGRLLPFLRCAMRLWWSLALGRVLLLHAQTSYGSSFWRKFVLALPVFAMRVPVIVHLHAGSFAEYHERGGAWRRFCMRLLFRRAFRVVVLSEEWRRWTKSVEPQAHVEVIPNSLAASTGLGMSVRPRGRPTVLFLGRVGPTKGTYDLLEAMAAVKRRITDVRLVIGGDGDIARLKAEVARLQLEDAVEYVGWADAQAKEKLLQECWVFALPSYKEGLPVGILEAMASSRGVITCPVGGIPFAVQHGVNGLLSPPGDVDALTANLLTTLEAPEFAQRLGQAGRQLFEDTFSHEVNLPKILALYRQAGARNLPALRRHSRAMG